MKFTFAAVAVAAGDAVAAAVAAVAGECLHAFSIGFGSHTLCKCFRHFYQPA